jgi:hypothetical protein
LRFNVISMTFAEINCVEIKRNNFQHTKKFIPFKSFWLYYGRKGNSNEAAHCNDSAVDVKCPKKQTTSFKSKGNRVICDLKSS